MKVPSRGALEKANELIDNILIEADAHGAHYAPCFRDDLVDNRKWVLLQIAEALDEAADGRPLCADENGPY